MFVDRVLSGMRPTGSLHLGHYHGVLKNWVRLQHEYECFFFVADWHALTTHYDSPEVIEAQRLGHGDRLARRGRRSGAGDPVHPVAACPEHAELHLLLSMITPLGWLERVPTYKDQQEKLAEKDLSTYGFLGYPLLQSADILIYRANLRAGGRGPGAAHRVHARDRAPLQPHLRTRTGLRGEGRGGDQEARRRSAASCTVELRTALPGAGRRTRRWRRRARCSRKRRTCPSATANACSASSKAAAR